MSKISIWKKVPGIAGRCNDIIYSCPILPPSQDILVYFGGDVQDIEESMEAHPDSRKYVEWSLQNTARILSTNFPKKHVLVVRPSRTYVTRNAMFSCFDNFVPSNEYGVPSFSPAHNALKHLQELVKSSLERIETCNVDEDPTHFSIEKTKLSLMGFSKGCVVLNQLLHEFHYWQSKSKSDAEINNFIKLIESMWWLDGGHAGSKDTWITEESVLESFAKLSNTTSLFTDRSFREFSDELLFKDLRIVGIDIHVHVTPYQVQDSCRPWVREEENRFCSMLQNMGIPIKPTLHFEDKPRSLKLHFNILKAVGNYTQ